MRYSSITNDKVATHMATDTKTHELTEDQMLIIRVALSAYQDNAELKGRFERAKMARELYEMFLYSEHVTLTTEGY